MICDECGKDPASTHLTKIVNGKKTEIHLCESCSENNEKFGFDSPFSIHQLLAGLLDNISEGTKKIDYINELRCNTCGITYQKFKQSGRFGCSDCYDFFRQQLSPLLKRIHGHENHVGKIPKKTDGVIKIKREIIKLKTELNLAIEIEEFEKAAELRDKIKDLQKKINE